MHPIWWILLASAAVAGASTLFKRRQAAHLRELSDDDFVNAYKTKFNDLDKAVIEMRNTIAKSLGVPGQKLAPDLTFASLSKFTGFITEYELGMSELGDELDYLRTEAGLKVTIRFPDTVGELIHEMILAKEKSG